MIRRCLLTYFEKGYDILNWSYLSSKDQKDGKKLCLNRFYIHLDIVKTCYVNSIYKTN